MSPRFDPEVVAALWRARRPGCPPIAHEFVETYSDCWVRFHSLPGSKRYPDSEDEYEMVLGRYNAVLDELFADVDVYVVTEDWSLTPTEPGFHPERGVLHPDGVRWWTIPNVSDPDPEFHNYTPLYASRESWRRGCIDHILRAVADDVLSGVFVTDVQLRRIYHPYDGGADVILANPHERERLRDRHTGWLSQHPSGL
jgi:hypothetical protein